MRWYRPFPAPDPTIWVAAITGAAALAGGAKSSRSSDRATRAQQDASRRAEAFEREQFEYEKAQRAKEEAERKAAWDAYQAMRAPYRRASAAVMRRWGFDVPDMDAQSGPPPGWEPGMDVPGARPPTGGPTGPVPLSQPMSDVPPMMAAPKLTLGNLSRWNRVIGLG